MNHTEQIMSFETFCQYDALRKKKTLRVYANIHQCWNILLEKIRIVVIEYTRGEN